MEPISNPNSVHTRQELADFLSTLAARVEGGRQLVENGDAASILEAASAWISDMDGYFENLGKEVPDEPNWSLVAMIFSASLVYE